MTTAYTRQTRHTLDQVKSQVQRQFAATVEPGLSPDALAAYAAVLGATVEAGQLVIGNMTSAHLGIELGVQPPPVSQSITQRENGIPKDELYQRPYRVVEQEIRGGATIDEAVAVGSRRLGTLTGVDLEMAKIRQAQQVLRVAKRKTYRRMTTSEKPCDLCQIASTQVYYTDDLLPIHDGCYCEVVEDDTDGDQDEADKDFEIPPGEEQVKAINELIEKGADPQDYRDLLAVREHGEIGPTLTWRGQSFTGPADLSNPVVVLDQRGRILQRKGRPLSLEDVNRRNAQDREGYRRRAAEKREIEGKPEPRYARDIEAARVKAEELVAKTEILAQERVTRLGKLTTPWTDEQYAKWDNPALPVEQQQEARRIAEELYHRASDVEKVISSVARASVESKGGFMSGWQFRLKEGPSLYRKIQKDAVADEVPVSVAAQGIKDAVRYTGVMPSEGYWQFGNELRETLKSLGAKVIKDPVGLPLEGYRGRNMAFTLHGMEFEMQVHTELGVALKEENHELYNVYRDLEDSEDPADQVLADKLFREMQERWDAIPITTGTPVVPTDRDVKDVKKILYVAKDSKYRGPTVPGGEADIGGSEMLRRERVPSSQYGMDYFPGRAEIVEAARSVPESLWDTLPIETIQLNTPIHANEASLKKKSIDQVVGGSEPFRTGYVAKLWRDDRGELHVVDGHHRVAMHNALGLDMQAHVMDESTYLQLVAEAGGPEAMSRMKAEEDAAAAKKK